MKKFYLFTLLSFSISQAQEVSFTPEYLGNTNYNACTVDMDGDYLDDVVTILSGQLRVYKQMPGGGFLTVNYPVSGLGTGFVTPDWSIAAGDFDKNGFNDLVLGNGSRVSLVKASIDGTGYNVITYPQNIFTQRTNFIDINNDGHLDLFACHDVAQSHAYRNDGEGNLIFDYSLMPTLAVGGNYASIWTDYDNDGDQDMYLAKCRGGAPAGDPQRINLLYKNNGDGTFTEAGAAAGVNDGAQSWATAIADFDNDGDMDFLLSNISDQNRLYRNNNDGTFTNVYATSGIASQVGSWEIQAADFNNDGFVDFLWENGKELYLNNGDMTFTGYDVDPEQGGIADLNNDGFLDVQSGSTVYFNDGNDNKWFKVNLQGIQSNRNGIGARVEIHGPWGKQIRDVRSGEGFANMSSLNVHFGLGNAEEITKAVIRWPSGIVDVIIDPEPNSTRLIIEGSSPELGIYDSESINFSFSPNPAEEILHINMSDDSAVNNAEIFDISGKKILSTEITSQQIPVDGLQSGNYLIRFTDDSGRTFTGRFVKK